MDSSLKRRLIPLWLVLLASAALLLQRSALADQAATSPATQAASMPKLLDLGSKSCIPCKKMAPILDELQAEYAAYFQVEFIDVGQRQNAWTIQKYSITSIPTQIFFDPDGTELWRHQGFIDKAAILAKWKELGYDFPSAQSQPATQPASTPE